MIKFKPIPWTKRYTVIQLENSAMVYDMDTKRHFGCTSNDYMHKDEAEWVALALNMLHEKDTKLATLAKLIEAKYEVENLQSKSRQVPLPQARIEFTHRAQRLGFRPTSIARYLKIHHTSISYYLKNFDDQGNPV